MSTNNKTHDGGNCKTMRVLIAVAATLTVTLALTTAARATPGPPMVETGDATEITRDSMKVCGTVNPHGQETTYHFTYKYFFSGESFEKTSSDASAGQGEAPVEVCATLTGIPAKVIVLYATWASNVSGESSGGNHEATTLPAIEGMKIGAATNVTAHSAVIHGSFEPNGYDTHYYFRCSYGDVVTVPVPAPGADAGSGTEVKEVEANITGVAGNSAVYCTLIASNSFGSEESPLSSFITAPAAPEVDAAPTVSDIAASTVAISGRVMTQNEPTAYWAEYVEADQYQPEAANPYATGAKGSFGGLEATNGVDSLVLLGLEDLKANTTYHYRLVAKNGAGETEGPDFIFTTGSPTPPMADTGEATGVSPTTATIEGTVNPSGLPTSYEFEVGTDTTYGGAEIFGDGGEGEGTETVQTTLSYLVPGTTYHYRIVATSRDGTVYGADRTFTTPEVSSPISQPASAPLLSFTPIAFPKEEKGQVVKKRMKKKVGRKSKRRARRHGHAKRSVKAGPGTK